MRENILFRLWPSKKAMFLASIEYVYELSEGIWTELLLKNGGGEESAEKLLKYESMHHGEFGMYRILFAGLTEADDPEIRASLAQTYRRFHKFIRQQISTHHKNQAEKSTRDIEFLAWAYLGLGTVANIAKELDLIPARQRRQLIHTVGLLLLKGTSL